MEKEFVDIIRETVSMPEFIKMKKVRYHINGNLYDHSIKVAYFCYKHHKRFGLRCDIRDLVLGALLHDYYLYDPHEKGKKHSRHWIEHPKKALKNAKIKYPNLSKMQQDMIENHMFPLTIKPPKTVAGWLVCFYDKVAAVDDRMFGKHKRIYKKGL